MTIRTLIAATALTVAGGAAFAEAHMEMPQTMPFADVDANSDGMIDMAELTTAFGEEGAMAYLAANDPDGDGMVTLAEVQAMAPVTMMGDDMSGEADMAGEEDDSVPTETIGDDMGDDDTTVGDN